VILNLGFPQCELNSKLSFGEKDEVSTVESQSESPGCKKSQFYSLPFGQAAANMY